MESRKLTLRIFQQVVRKGTSNAGVGHVAKDSGGLELLQYAGLGSLIPKHVLSPRQAHRGLATSFQQSMDHVCAELDANAPRSS